MNNDRLKTLCEKRILCEIYSNPDDTNKFCVGYILAVDDDHCVVQRIDRYGAYDGMSCFFNEDIFQISTDTKYLRAMLKLSQHKCDNAIKDAPADELLNGILYDIKQNNRICEIEVCDSRLCNAVGYIGCFNEDSINLLCVDDLGEDDGNTVVDMNAISHVTYDSTDTVRLEILREQQV